MLAMSIANTEEMQCWLASQKVGRKDKGVLVLLKGIIGNITHARGEGKLSHDVSHITVVSFNEVTHLAGVGDCFFGLRTLGGKGLIGELRILSGRQDILPTVFRCLFRSLCRA